MFEDKIVDKQRWKLTKIIALTVLSLAGVLSLVIIGGNVALILRGQENSTLTNWGGLVLSSVFGNMSLGLVIAFFFDKESK